MKVSVLRFPGSNCDFDCADMMTRHFAAQVEYLWHEQNEIPHGTDLVMVPGGFSFGDYLRSGALAAHAPVTEALRKFADSGGYVIGICNGFQILTESRILPGALLHNVSQKFICKDVFIKNSREEVSRIPIAHGEGRYWASAKIIQGLTDQGLIAYKYCTKDGQETAEANPNGSLEHIAGIFSKNKRVLGLMPHPERASDYVLGQRSDGLKMVKEFLS